MTEIATRYQSRSKREIRETLEEALKRDREAVPEIRKRIDSIFDLCTSMHVQDETLLFEIELFKAAVEDAIHWVSLDRIKGGQKEGTSTPLDVTRHYQGSERLFKVIEEVAADAHKAHLITLVSGSSPKPSEEDLAEALRPATHGSNEEQEYVQSNCRPNYIA